MSIVPPRICVSIDEDGMACGGVALEGESADANELINNADVDKLKAASSLAKRGRVFAVFMEAP